MDQFDRATMLEQAERENVLRHERGKAKARDKPSLSHCEDCGNQIPEGRLQALRGVTRCVGCQQEFEKNTRYRGRGKR